MTRALWFSLVLALLGVTICVGRALADDRTTTRTLALSCIAEAGWSTSDCAAILGVLELRATRAGVPIATMARRYVSAWKVRPTPRLRWVLAITSACEQPRHWPARRLDWEAHRPQCLATFALVREYLAGGVQSPCAAAVHFGSRTHAVDVERAKRAGWRRARCAERTRNAFYAEGR